MCCTYGCCRSPFDLSRRISFSPVSGEGRDLLYGELPGIAAQAQPGICGGGDAGLEGHGRGGALLCRPALVGLPPTVGPGAGTGGGGPARRGIRVEHPDRKPASVDGILLSADRRPLQDPL